MNCPQSYDFRGIYCDVGEYRDHAYNACVFSGPDTSKTPTNFQGKLLLADPCLRCSQFHKSVVLINQHTSDKGAMGLILNQPTGRNVGDLLSDPMFDPLSKLAVHDGGPVDQEQLTFSSFWWSPENQLRWAVRISAEDAAKHVKQPGRIVRAFIGYSGWVAGQLENEMKSPSWVPVDPTPDLLSHTHDRKLWSTLLGNISPMHRILAQAPEDPELN